MTEQTSTEQAAKNVFDAVLGIYATDGDPNETAYEAGRLLVRKARQHDATLGTLMGVADLLGALVKGMEAESDVRPLKGSP